MTLRMGHPGDLRSLHVLGDKTRVSHAATVRVQTRKYLCALRWGGRLRESGRRLEMSGVGGVGVAMVAVGRSADPSSYLYHPRSVTSRHSRGPCCYARLDLLSDCNATKGGPTRPHLEDLHRQRPLPVRHRLSYPHHANSPLTVQRSSPPSLSSSLDHAPFSSVPSSSVVASDADFKAPFLQMPWAPYTHPDAANADLNFTPIGSPRSLDPTGKTSWYYTPFPSPFNNLFIHFNKPLSLRFVLGKRSPKTEQPKTEVKMETKRFGLWSRSTSTPPHDSEDPTTTPTKLEIAQISVLIEMPSLHHSALYGAPKPSYLDDELPELVIGYARCYKHDFATHHQTEEEEKDCHPRI